MAKKIPIETKASLLEYYFAEKSTIPTPADLLVISTLKKRYKKSYRNLDKHSYRNDTKSHIEIWTASMPTRA